MIQAIKVVNENQIKSIICNTFGEFCDQAILIAECESGLNPKSVNYTDAKITGYNSWGLFMHNEPQFDGWDNPVVSTEKAWNKFSNRGWWPWRNCAVKNRLI